MKKISKIAIPAEIIEFYKEMEQIKQKYMQNLPLLELDDAQKRHRLEQNVPLLNLIDFKIDAEAAHQVFEELVGVVLKYRPDIKDKVEKIQNAIKDSDHGLAYLVDKLVWQDEKCLSGFAAEHSLDGELLSLLLVNTARPFVISVAEGLQSQVISGGGHQNVCPVCGWDPAISVTEAGDERKRRLHCSLCDSSWYFKSLECPHCLNEDHESLKYYALEGDESYRLNVCEKCKGYIKAVDESRLVAKEPTALMDIKSIYLDLFASDNGYRKKDVVSHVPDTQ